MDDEERWTMYIWENCSRFPALRNGTQKLCLLEAITMKVQHLFGHKSNLFSARRSLSRSFSHGHPRISGYSVHYQSSVLKILRVFTWLVSLHLWFLINIITLLLTMPINVSQTSQKTTTIVILWMADVPAWSSISAAAYRGLNNVFRNKRIYIYQSPSFLR